MRIHEYFATIIVVFSLILASCASHTAVYPDPVNIQSVIQPGDTVKIVTKDNQETEFVVAEVTDEAIVGENIEVPLNDIMGMKQETVSAGENALIITILTLGVASAVILSPPLPYAETRPESEAIISTLEDVPADWSLDIVCEVPSGVTISDIPNGKSFLCTATSFGLASCTFFNSMEEPPIVTAVPTLSEWGLITMAGILGIFGLLAIRRRKVTA